MGSLTRTAAPVSLPVTLDEVKAHARIDEDLTDLDATLVGYIRGAVEYFDGRDGYLGRALITQSWRLSLDDWPGGVMFPLPLAPLISVDAIQYRDGGSPTTQTLAASAYEVDTASEPGRIALASGHSWPSVSDSLNAITIDFTCGYGPDAADVPERIRIAIASMAAHWYEAPIPVSAGGSLVELIPFHMRALVDNYRMFV